MNLIAPLGDALWMAFAMFWEILWPLILGFGLSDLVQAVVSKREMSRLLPDDAPKTLAIACGLGAASSSCSYAAVALARSIFRKGADFTAAMAFQLASTNLVAELSIILIVLMGWQFAAAEFAGGPLMVAIVAVLFKIFLSRKLVREARARPFALATSQVKRRPHCNQPLFRDGLGIGVEGHWRRATHCGSVSGVGSTGFLEAFLPHAPPRSGGNLGSNYRAARRCHFVRMLGWKYPSRRRSLEWWHQLWRRDRVHLRRFDCPANHRHLPKILRLESEWSDYRCVLYRDDGCGADHRITFPSAGSRALTTQRANRRSVDHIQLHDRHEHHLSGDRHLVSDSLF